MEVVNGISMEIGVLISIEIPSRGRRPSAFREVRVS
jgi:hypothetical protein